MNRKQQTPFDIENWRGKLAKELRYNELLNTYSPLYSEIEDLNTPNFWDSFNTTGEKGKNPMDEDRIHIVSKLINGKEINLLNVGFGSASLEKEYFRRHSKENVKWNGIDISPESVKNAKKEFSHCKFEVGNILNLRYKNNIFDYVISLEVLEHIKPRNTIKALNEIFRVLKPGNYFIVSVPLNEGLKDMIARGENPNAHVRTYTEELIKAELEIVGFKICKKKKLFAFHNFYKLKTFIAKQIVPWKFYPNDVIIFAQKPI